MIDVEFPSQVEGQEKDYVQNWVLCDDFGSINCSWCSWYFFSFNWTPMLRSPSFVSVSLQWSHCKLGMHVWCLVWTLHMNEIKVCMFWHFFVYLYFYIILHRLKPIYTYTYIPTLYNYTIYKWAIDMRDIHLFIFW